MRAATTIIVVMEAESFPSLNTTDKTLLDALVGSRKYCEFEEAIGV
jgi:hypothetical protein